MLIGVAGALIVVLASLPWWLPGRVVALRVRVFARVNGDEGIPIPGELIGVEHFTEVYGHPAAVGRSRGAALSDLFWYWLSPGAHVHQEHLEAGVRYDSVAEATRGFLAMPRSAAQELTVRCVRRTLPAAAGRARLRDLMMPVWAEFFHELVFGEPCSPAARALIVGHADDVVTALKCCGLRHMDRRDRLTRYIAERLDEARRPLPAELTTEEQVFYLQGTFFTTGVVQMSDAMAHLLMTLAQHPAAQARVAGGDEDHLDQVLNETFRLYPLFGVAHRVTTAEITLDERTTVPAGSVVCFNYPEFHRAGLADPDRFDPERFAPGRRGHELNHIPFGIAANRPCPAWRIAPIVMRTAVEEILRSHALASTASHTRSMPGRGPCLLLDRADPGRHRGALMWMRIRDRWENVRLSLVQLALGTYMVRDARRQRLCERYFTAEDRDARPDTCRRQ